MKKTFSILAAGKKIMTILLSLLMMIQMGVFPEGKAENNFGDLNQYVNSVKYTVLRDGNYVELNSENNVVYPGEAMNIGITFSIPNSQTITQGEMAMDFTSAIPFDGTIENGVFVYKPMLFRDQPGIAEYKIDTIEHKIYVKLYKI